MARPRCRAFLGLAKFAPLFVAHVRAKTWARLGRGYTMAKPGKNGNVPPQIGQFTAQNQPSPQAKSAGRQRWQARQLLAEDLFALLVQPTEQNGQKRPKIEVLFERVLQGLLIKDPAKWTEKQAALVFKVIELVMPKEGKLDVNLQVPALNMDEMRAIMAERKHANRKRSPHTLAE